MILNGCCLEILKDGVFVEENSDGYVTLNHGDTYKIRLKSTEHGAAKIFIDGELIGDFVVRPITSTVIERPSGAKKLLTFFKAGSVESKAALLEGVSDENLGIVKAVFRPMISNVEYQVLRSKGGQHVNCTDRGIRGAEAGGTGLTGYSSQEFKEVLMELDESNPITLVVRLVCAPDHPKVSPLPGRRSTPTPPPLPRSSD